MKKYAIICFLTIALIQNSFAQGISNPQPILLDENGSPTIDSGVDILLNCDNNNVVIEASYPNVGNTTEYTIEAIPFTPQRYLSFDGTTVTPPPGPGAIVTTLADDIWSAENELNSNGKPLNLCFFGNQRKYFRYSTNGAISFNTIGNYPTPPPYTLYDTGDFADWNIQNMGKIYPNANMNAYRESILTPFHDVNPSDSDFQLDTYTFWDIRGEVGERIFIFGFHKNPMFLCGSDFGFATHQMVFYETTNIIEFHIKDKPICDTWTEGYAALGIQNKGLDLGYAPPRRDNLEHWQILESTVNGFDPSYPVEPSESWRFIPSGGTLRPIFTWYKNYDFVTNIGALIDVNDIDSSTTLNPNNPIQNFSPLVDTIYTAQVIYTNECSGEQTITTQSVTFIVDCVLSTNEFLLDNTITIFPTVFSDFTTIQSDKNLSNVNLSIYTILGEKVRKTKVNLGKQSFILSRKNLLRGIYFLNFTDKNNNVIATKKLIIKD